MPVNRTNAYMLAQFIPALALQRHSRAVVSGLKRARPMSSSQASRMADLMQQHPVLGISDDGMSTQTV